MNRVLPLLFCLAMSSCSIARPMLLSSASAGPEQEEIVGMTTGTASQSWLFGWAMDKGADYSTQAALEDALKGKAADTLINVFGDENCWYLPHPDFYCYRKCRLRLTGTAVRYKKAGPPPPAR
ncbi:MAG: hypothetical protein PHU21_07250 [Elusimicrobia bacterium]|nr:hypothetical protein [Elusimicrobiota bacterium]